MEIAAIGSGAGAELANQQAQQIEAQPLTEQGGGSAEVTGGEPAGRRFEVVLSAVDEVESRSVSVPEISFDRIFERLGQADEAVSQMRSEFLGNLGNDTFMEPLKRADRMAEEVRSRVAEQKVETVLEKSMLQMRADNAIAREYMQASTAANAQLQESSAQLMLSMAGMSFFKEMVKAAVSGMNKLINAR